MDGRDRKTNVFAAAVKRGGDTKHAKDLGSSTTTTANADETNPPDDVHGVVAVDITFDFSVNVIDCILILNIYKLVGILHANHVGIKSRTRKGIFWANDVGTLHVTSYLILADTTTPSPSFFSFVSWGVLL